MSDHISSAVKTEQPTGQARGLLGTLRGYLVAGLLVWVPLVITWWVVISLVQLMDHTLVLLPSAYRPEALLGLHIPGLGVILALAVLLITGLIAANIIGRRLVGVWEGMLARIPLVRSVYSAVKQLMQTFLSSESRAFRKVLLVEYPSKGLWTLAFLAGDRVSEVQEKTAKEMLTVYVPTAPNPTSGYVIFVAKDEVLELDMSVEEAMRMVISLGMVVPSARGHGRMAEMPVVAAPEARL